MRCKDFREIIDSYLSDELLTETNHEVLSHLEACADCRKVIEARREVRQHLRSAVLNAPEYRIDDNFSHNLRTHLQHEALKTQTEKTSSFFGFNSWVAASAAAVLLVAFAVGFIFLSDQGEPKTVAATKDYHSDQVASENIVNIAFGDHEHCAIKKGGGGEAVAHAVTPAKFADTEQVALPVLKKVLKDSKLRNTHTCRYKDTDFTHMIVEKDDKLLSVMLTDRDEQSALNKDIALFTSKKYNLAKFDVKDSSVFVISAFDQETNSNAAKTLYEPLHKYLDKKDSSFQTALLTFY